MRRLLVLGVALAAAAVACAPRSHVAPAGRPAVAPAAGPPFWRVEHAGRTSHLFGTLHVPMHLAHTLGPNGAQALAEATTLFVEMDLTDPARSRALAAEIARAGRLPRGASLRVRLGPGDWRRLRQVIPRTSEAQLDRLEPWLASLTVIQAIAGKAALTPRTSRQAGPPFDAALVARARQRRVPVVELDSLREQLAAFTSLPRPDALAMLRELLAGPDAAEEQLEGIVRAYEAVDADRQLTALVNDMERRTPTFAEHLLFQRNARWARTLDGPLRRGGAFVAVGAAHLVGPRGLPALLAARGFRVTRVGTAGRDGVSVPDRASP